MLTVAVIGAGPLGRRLALAALRAGCRVFVEDVMPANLHHAQEELRAALGPEALPAAEFVSTVEEAVRQADLVIDCVPDELESKLEIFCLIDRMAPPRTVLATPMLRHSITDLASCTYRAEQCIAIAAEAAELMASEPGELLLRKPPQASEQTIALVAGFFASLGFKPRVELETVEPNPAAL